MMRKLRRLEAWVVILIVGSWLAAGITVHAIYWGTESHSTTINCVPAGSAQHPAGVTGYPCSVQTPNDATRWWLAAGVVEGLTIVVAFGVRASAGRRV